MSSSPDGCSRVLLASEITLFRKTSKDCAESLLRLLLSSSSSAVAFALILVWIR